ncbi:unnamed protein product [Candida verbasci]|uniref:Cytidyltransferase-like domain-containing protein n=1 Tax=Candida verbasci TaxID=1227364 RepID=A0A9W4XE44_9ASCO|nr:unnamed protein product [Candida verbasci]
MMVNPVIIIEDPINYDYSDFITSINHNFTNSSQLDLLITGNIVDASDLNEILFKYYSLIRKLNPNYQFKINILFNLLGYKIKELSLNWNKGYMVNNEADFKFLNLENANYKLKSEHLSDVHDYKTSMHFNTTACGGTFDHLHEGHKILLSMSVFLTRQDLIIGITGAELLKNKKFKEVLQSFDYRRAEVAKFIQLIIPKMVRFEIYEINDICGPTGYINDIDSLIVSHETKSGGEFVNSYRKKYRFKPLDITEIKVIGDENSNESNKWANKLSSTDIREAEYNKLQNIGQI